MGWLKTLSKLHTFTRKSFFVMFFRHKYIRQRENLFCDVLFMDKPESSKNQWNYKTTKMVKL